MAIPSQDACREVNKGVNAMGGAIATLCGCMFVGDSDVCAFKDISPLCVIPYQSYVPRLADLHVVS